LVELEFIRKDAVINQQHKVGQIRQFIGSRKVLTLRRRVTCDSSSIFWKQAHLRSSTRLLLR
jgi:hypothetical protein